MKSNRFWTAAVVLFGLTSVLGAQQPLSPRDQLQQYVVQLQANPSDDGLRTKIIQLAQRLQPPPAVPSEADELAGRAQYIFEHANSSSDLLQAADAFGKVSRVAPWVPYYYFDAALAFEKANDPVNTLKNYRWALLGYPSDSQDAEKIHEKIGALSYVVEQQQKQEKQAEAQRQASAQAEREVEAQREAQEAEEDAANRDWGGIWRINGRNNRNVHWTFEVRNGELILTAVVDRADTYDAVGHTAVTRYKCNPGCRIAVRDGNPDGRLELNAQGDTILDYEPFGDHSRPFQTLSRASQ